MVLSKQIHSNGEKKREKKTSRKVYKTLFQTRNNTNPGKNKHKFNSNLFHFFFPLLTSTS